MERMAQKKPKTPVTPKANDKKSAKPALWVVVTFSDGVVYKIPASIVADRIARRDGININVVLRMHDVLVDQASQMPWLQLQPYAQLQHRAAVDYITAWQGAEKVVE
jgi:hypothetical protein